MTGGGGAVLPYMGAICETPKGMVFQLFWSEIGNRF